VSDVETGGGGAIGGNVHTRGGDFAGRDKTDINIDFIPPPPGDYPPDHPLRQYKMADIVASLVGDRMTGRIGLIEQVALIEQAGVRAQADRLTMIGEMNDLKREMNNLKSGQYPRWLQVLMISLSIALLVAAVIFIMKFG
jgi:hypothetical protein